MEAWFGPYRLVRELDPVPIAGRVRRWAAVHDRDHSGHLVYSLGPARDRFTKKRFLAAAEPLAALRHPHILGVECYALSDRLGACLVTPFSGHHDGIVTLWDLLDHKGGRLSPAEARRATTHILEALGAAHTANIADNALSLDRVHVDPKGSLLIELPGLERTLRRREAPTAGDFRTDVRAAGMLTHQLLAGAPPLRGLANLPRDLEYRWHHWMARALDPLDGFASAGEALASLPPTALAPLPEPMGLVRSLIGKIRSALPLL